MSYKAIRRGSSYARQTIFKEERAKMKRFLHLLSLVAASLPIVALAGITSRIKADGHENVPLVQEPAADPARVEAEMRNLENLAVAAIRRNTAAANQQHQGNQCCRLAVHSGKNIVPTLYIGLKVSFLVIRASRGT